MTPDFAEIAPYLKSPLVLIGFCLFLAFLFARKLLTSGIIPPIGAGRGAQIIRLLLLYGFVIGVLVIVLGFGLKYRELSRERQLAAVGLVVSELQHNLYVVHELQDNTRTLVAVAMTVASVLRNPRFAINSGLFPERNITGTLKKSANLYIERYRWLIRSGLLHDRRQLHLFREQNAAIVQTIDVTISTVRSLGDQSGRRYVISEAAYDADLPILRKVTIVRTDAIGNLYAESQEARDNYYRVAASVTEYLEAVRHYCRYNVPNQAALGAALASERLTLHLLSSMRHDFRVLSIAIKHNIAALSSPSRLDSDSAHLRVFQSDSATQRAGTIYAIWSA